MHRVEDIHALHVDVQVLFLTDGFQRLVDGSVFHQAILYGFHGIVSLRFVMYLCFLFGFVGKADAALSGEDAAFDAVMKIGWPEGRIPLAEATVYLATSPKSNSAYEGINHALELVRQTGNLPVPLHLRNAPTKLMKQLGYGKDYKYAHAYENHFVKQQFLPDELDKSRIWHPQANAQEAKLKERMQSLWGDRFNE